MKRIISIIQNRIKVKITPIDLKDFDNELKKFKSIYNSAWAPNWGFVPFTEEEINYISADLKQLVEPSLVLFAEMDGKRIAFTLTLPDFNQVFYKMNGRLFPFGFLKLLKEKKKIEWARILILGVAPEFQKKGIDALLYWALIQNAAKLGIKYGEASWILEDNEMMNNALINMGGELYKKYRIYNIKF